MLLAAYGMFVVSALGVLALAAGAVMWIKLSRQSEGNHKKTDRTNP